MSGLATALLILLGCILFVVGSVYGLLKRVGTRKVPAGKPVDMSGKTLDPLNNTELNLDARVALKLKDLATGKVIEIMINPTGVFVQGGFEADTGLTGRKIMVDTYGGLIPHGGGAFSGKDASKVDRSAAYMARFAAKNIVASDLAKECLVSVAYAIGHEEPLMVLAIDENGKDISNLIKDKFDFRPNAIIERLGLRQPIFGKTAAYGHFGKPDLPWEEIID